MLIRGAIYFNEFMRHYFPLIYGKANSLLNNKDYLHDKIYSMIEKRRIGIDNIRYATSWS